MSDKKISAKYWSMINVIEPGVSKRITWLEAWEKLATWGNFEGQPYTNTKNETKFYIFIGDAMVKMLNITDGWDDKNGDWKWENVIPQALDYIFDEGLIKKPRARRKDAKVQTVRKAIVNSAKFALDSHETEEMNNSIAEAEKARKNEEFEKEWYSEKNLEDLKKRLSGMSAKRSMWKKKNRDTTELDAMMEDFREKIKDIKVKLDIK